MSKTALVRCVHTDSEHPIFGVTTTALSILFGVVAVVTSVTKVPSQNYEVGAEITSCCISDLRVAQQKA